MPGLTVLRWFGSTKPPVHINKQNRGTRSSTVCTAVSGFGNGSAASSPEDPPEETDVSPSGTLNQLQTAAWDLRRLVGLVAVPSLQLASRLLCRRWEPLQDQVQQHLASMEGIKDACKALHVDSLQDLQVRSLAGRCQTPHAVRFLIGKAVSKATVCLTSRRMSWVVCCFLRAFTKYWRWMATRRSWQSIISKLTSLHIWSICGGCSGRCLMLSIGR